MLKFAVGFIAIWALLTVLRLRSATISRVVDGDSVELRIGGLDGHVERVRIVAIDAPEYHGQAHGREARRALADLLGQHQVRIVRKGRDRYGRTLASLYAGRVPVAAWLVVNGHAWPSDSWLMTVLSISARLRRRGLWGGPSPLRPGTWRRLSG